ASATNISAIGRGRRTFLTRQLRAFLKEAFNFFEFAAHYGCVEVGASDFRMGLQEAHCGVLCHSMGRTSANVMVRASEVGKPRSELFPAFFCGHLFNRRLIESLLERNPALIAVLERQRVLDIPQAERLRSIVISARKSGTRLMVLTTQCLE